MPIKFNVNKIGVTDQCPGGLRWQGQGKRRMSAMELLLERLLLADPCPLPPDPVDPTVGFFSAP